MDWECIKAAISEMLGVGAAILLVRFLTEKGLTALGEEAGKRLLVKILKSIGKRIVPWLGIAFIIWDIYQLIKHCL